MKSFLVYLAGPITGLSYGAATNWRQRATVELAGLSGGRIETLSPMRHKEYLAPADKTADLTKIADSYEGSILSSQRGIFYRDKLDCTRADLVLVNLLGAERVSIGTVMEIAWANGRDIPLVLVMPMGSVHEHSMLREACGFRTPSFDEALLTTFKILMPDDWRAMSAQAVKAAA
jgi:nucleoside 2-deoxyribosyltransferase